MNTIPSIAALISEAAPPPAGERRRVLATLRDNGDVLQVALASVVSDSDVVHVAGDVPEADLNAPYAVCGAHVWRRSGDSWVRIPTVGLTGGVLARNRGVLETEALAGASAAVIGLGSGGSVIADQLARAGVGRLVVIDRDRLEVANVGRHLCDLTDLGRRKTDAVADRLRARNPNVCIEKHDFDILEDPDGLALAVEGCTVLIGGTDGNASRRVVNALAVATGRTAIFGRAYTRACGGDVIRVRSDGPCYECLFAALSTDEEVTSVRSAGAPAYAAEAVRVEPGLALDIAPIAAMCSRLAIQELVRGRASSLESLDKDFPGSLFFWANRREGQFAGWSPMGFGHSALAVHRWYSARTKRNPSCPTCNEDAFLASLTHRADLGASRSSS